GAIHLLEEDDQVRTLVCERWRAFTVDEYQDVNVLQQSLLDLWLGDGDDVCVVGDDYQSIYGFTGASAEWLLALPQRFPQAHVVRLEQNYRSTPQVLDLANRLVPKLGGGDRAQCRGRAGLARGAAGEARRARADPAGGSLTTRTAGRAIRRRSAGVRRLAARAVRGDGGPRRASPDASSCEGARIRGGASATARGR